MHCSPKNVSRRLFLQHSAGAALAMSAAGSSTSAASKTRPRFTFVQINDTHVEGPRDDGKGTAYAMANEKLAWWVAEMNRGKTPDFVVGIGDMIHGESLERLPLELDYFRRAIEPLRCPFYPAMGNHEVVQREGSADRELALARRQTHQRSGVRRVILRTGLVRMMHREVLPVPLVFLHEATELLLELCRQGLIRRIRKPQRVTGIFEYSVLQQGVHLMLALEGKFYMARRAHRKPGIGFQRFPCHATEPRKFRAWNS